MKICADAPPEQVLSYKLLSEISDLAHSGYINSSTAKKLVSVLSENGCSAKEYVDAHGLSQIRDEETVKKFVARAIVQNEKSVSDYKKGKLNAKKAIAGSIMRESGGRADPIVLDRVLSEMLDQIK